MVERMIGNIQTEGDILLFCIGSLHGNEAAGYLGLKNVFAQIEKNSIQINGQFTAILGNKTAYLEKKRYLDGDLNRAWTKENVDKALLEKIDDLAPKLTPFNVDISSIYQSIDSTNNHKDWPEDTRVLTDQFSPANLLKND